MRACRDPLIRAVWGMRQPQQSVREKSVSGEGAVGAAKGQSPVTGPQTLWAYTMACHQL